MKFIDCHNHLLYGLDDGFKTKEDSINMLKQAEESGIEKIILTPHFKEQVVENDKKVIIEKFEAFKTLLKEHQIHIEVYPGSEIFLSKQTIELMPTLQTLNNTKYCLVETHRAFTSMIYDLREELYNLSVDGYQVILAHPERYEITYDNPQYIYQLVKDGHLMQVNVTSLSEKSHAYKMVRKLLEAHLVHIIASDAHDLVHRPLALAEGYERVKKWVGETYANALFYENPLKVINNEIIDQGPIKPFKTKKWGIF